MTSPETQTAIQSGQEFINNFHNDMLVAAHNLGLDGPKEAELIQEINETFSSEADTYLYGYPAELAHVRDQINGFDYLLDLNGGLVHQMAKDKGISPGQLSAELSQMDNKLVETSRNDPWQPEDNRMVGALGEKNPHTMIMQNAMCKD